MRRRPCRHDVFKVDTYGGRYVEWCRECGAFRHGHWLNDRFGGGHGSCTRWRFPRGSAFAELLAVARRLVRHLVDDPDYDAPPHEDETPDGCIDGWCEHPLCQLDRLQARFP